MWTFQVFWNVTWSKKTSKKKQKYKELIFELKKKNSQLKVKLVPIIIGVISEWSSCQYIGSDNSNTKENLLGIRVITPYFEGMGLSLPNY